MVREELIACFQDTLKMSKTGVLGVKTFKSILTNKVYKEGFVSDVAKSGKWGSVTVHKGTSLEIARKYQNFGRIAVLNFANPEYPGGGVMHGAMAQEECLCRSSNLYACISQKNVLKDYYSYHRTYGNSFYSDRLIYTKDIIVFKNDDEIPQILPKNEWFTVDVITCAAPYLGNHKYINSTVLLNLFKRRIKNIFEAARDNEVDVLVLGAFGCGAFKNPPLVVAEAFFETISFQSYDNIFKHIVFAIKPTGECCPNLGAFEKCINYFKAFKSEICKALESEECTVLPMLMLPREERKSALLDNVSIDDEKFHLWQIRNKYYGKQFSILGDSLSTLDGYNPAGYKVFYEGNICESSGIIQMRDTWWDKVISYFGGELLVNNAWSGSRVTKLPDYNGSMQLFPSGSSDERTSLLHINEVMPDVIIIYLGTNDWAYGVELYDETNILGVDYHGYFSHAYNSMLRKLKRNYPNSEIWCCTLNETYMSCNSDFVFPHEYAGTHIEKYNKIIREAVRGNHCNLIDLYQYRIPYDTIDGTHATADGASTIAKMMIRSMLEPNTESFFE